MTHSHFPDVDICAPGWDMAGATNTFWDSAGIILQKHWPYYHLWSGTSFATPIVAGLCGLIKSVNPCLTPAQVQYILKVTADPVVDANSYPGLVGAGRINAYQAVKYAQDNYGYEEYIIGNGQNITWTTEHQAKNITICGGGKLTIKSTVYMLPGSDIIIEKGGELIIDEGYITTCKGLWNGIQVRGRIDEDQYSYNNQGHLTLIHEATIENARIEAQTIKVDSSVTDPYSTGGIIQAVNANFINCITGISFMPYENFLNDKRNIKNNLSYLNNCNFKLDTNFYHVFNSPKQFIYMENVRGISIKGCTFLNQLLENGDTANATATLNAIPVDFELTIEQSNIHQNYEALSNILKGLKHNTVSALNLDSAQIAGLLDIQDNETLPGIYARNLLLTSGYLTYQEPYLFPDDLKKMEIKPGPAGNEYNELVKLCVFPNPAAYYTIIDFYFDQDESAEILDPQVQVNIYDLRGNLMKTLNSSQYADQLVLDVRGFIPGIYLIDLNRNGQRISTSKLIVNR